MRDEGRRVREAEEALQIDTRAARQVRRLFGRQPAEGDDRALARERVRDDALLRPDARDRRRDEAADLHPPATARDDGAAILFFSSELTEFRSSATGY